MAALHSAGHEIALVLTQPDRPSGRGLKLQPPPVKQFAQSHGINVAQPRSLRLDGKFSDDAKAAQSLLQSLQADAMVVAAYGLILPQWVLDTPRLGCFNIHASLLPRWRGAAPIHRAIEAGDASTGITIMQMDAGLDTGDMLAMQSLPIQGTDTTASLHDKLAALGAALMLQTLAQVQQGRSQPAVQPAEGITYASKINKAEATVDWTQSAKTIAQRVRAFNPAPGAMTTLAGETLKIWMAEASPNTPPASQTYGTILTVDHTGISVAAADSIVILTELQRPGGKRLNAAEFLRGFDVQPGMRLGQAVVR
jgi:methionyl-tRNA formyltransferase